MSNIRIAVRDTTDTHNVGFFDNQNGIKYSSAELNRFLKGACSFLTIKYFSKDIETITSGCKLAFQYKNRDYWLTINSVQKNGLMMQITAFSLSLEANKEKRAAYKASSAMTFKQYLNYIDPEHAFTLGINEVEDKSMKLEWSGSDTVLARLYSIANSFSAELEFLTELNDDYSLKQHTINVHRAGNLGKIKKGLPVRLGNELEVINYSENIDNLYTAIRATGKDGLTISGLNKKVYDDEGDLLFYSSGKTLYAPQARDRFPSISHKANDSYICLEVGSTEYTSAEALYGYMLSQLKKYCEPMVDYEVRGFAESDIGDTLTLIDDFHYDPPLYVQARVSEQVDDLLDNSNNKTSFTNYVRKTSEISDELQKRVDELVEASKPYLIKLSTDNGVIFKNQIGQSLITPSLYKGGKKIDADVTWRWALDGDVTTGQTYLVKGADITDTMTLTVAAYVGNDEVAVDEISLVNVVDGKIGTPGTPGVDGRTPYVHTAWANNETGTSGFSLENSANRLYMGIYSDFELNDSTDPTKYQWTKIKGDPGEKGEQGERGIPGLQGAKGDQGIAGAKGADGKTQYTHIAYADSPDGKTNFSVSASDRKYIGMYVDFIATDSIVPTDYAWTLVKGADGAQGTAGKAGADGKTPYFHTAYANSYDGATGFSVTDSSNKTYLGTYTDYVQADSTDYKKYTWTLIRGNDGTGIANVTNYYLATTLTTGVTASTAGWTTTVQQISVDKRYLWNYRVELYTDGTNKTTVPAVIGVYGATGATGSTGAQGATGATGQTGALDEKQVSDMNNKIDGKADGKLTQEQLNALSEKTALVKSELDAKASLDTVNQWMKSYQNFVNSNEANRAKAEKDLIAASQRIAALELNLGDLSQRWNFIDTYMSSSNEGLLIGKNDGSSSMLFNPNGRISMFSAGVEVMYISQGVIHIENGIFSKTIQIGRFREEQYQLNLDMNVMRYVGG